MASKLLYLHMDSETFNKFPALEQARGVIRALQTSLMVYKIVSNIVSNINLAK